MRVLAALAAVTAVAGCATGVQTDSPSPSPAYVPPNKLVSCRADLPEDWREKLASNEITAGPKERVTIVAANQDASTTLVKTTRSDRSTELVLRDRSRRQQVTTLQDEAQLFNVQFDGRWVVYSTSPSPANLGSDGHVWDSRKDGAPQRINVGGANAVLNGKALWSDTKEVHVHDLATKKDKVIGRGLAPVFFGETVLWSQNNRFRAATQDGTEAVVPEQLKNAKPDASMASDGRTLVWSEGDLLHGWRADWTETRKLAEIKSVPKTESIVFPRVNGDFVSWRSESSYVTDVRNGSTVYMGDRTFSLEIRGGALVRDGGQIAAAIPVSALSPLPAC